MSRQRVTIRTLRAAGIEQVYLHASLRLWERHRISITPTEYLNLCREIGHALPTLEPTYTNDARCRVHYRIHGQLVEFVYEEPTGLIITALCRPTPRTARRATHLRTGRRGKAARGRREYARPHQARWEEETE